MLINIPIQLNLKRQKAFQVPSCSFSQTYCLVYAKRFVLLYKKYTNLNAEIQNTHLVTTKLWHIKSSWA